MRIILTNSISTLFLDTNFHSQVIAGLQALKELADIYAVNYLH